MHLLSLTINKSGLITKCIQGNFTGSRKLPELVVIRGGHILELLKLDESKRLQTVVSTDAFGCLRSLQPFRLPGSTKDYIVVGSDSGRITILEYDPARNQFAKVHMETFGRSGCRRIIPGEYLAADPRGRAVMIGAIEKQKLVYVLSRDTQSKLTISSPLEAHKGSTVVFDLCGVDVGFDNPIFAALEFDYTEVHSTDPGAEQPQKVLTYYELDLGLNHVSRRWSEPVDNSANALVPCPGWKDGPGGVLVCSAGWVSWRSEGKEPVGVPLPRRAGAENGEVLVLATALHKVRGGFFVMLQSELGDLYRVSLEWHGDTVTGIEVAYLDTAPVAATMAVLRNGYLFLAPEAGPQRLYRILGLGAPIPPPSSAEEVPTFAPSLGELKNLEPADELASLCPLTDTRVRMAGSEEAARIYALCGRGGASALRILRHGLVASQVGATDLKKEPTGVWTIPSAGDGPGDRYIILSFSATTSVLSVSGERMSEVQDSGLSTTVRTIAAGVLGGDETGSANSAIVQVHPGGIRIVRAGGRAQEWQPGGHRQVRHAALNGTQVAVVLNDSELLYFELDTAGQLSLTESRPGDGAEIVAVALAPASSRGKGRFLAIADALSRVHILSLTPGDGLRPTAVQVLDDCAQSLAFEDTFEGPAPLHLCVGLRNGLLTRSAVDSISGVLADTRIRLLGTAPVRLQQVRAAGRPALLALSSRSWLCCAGGIQTAVPGSSGSGVVGPYYMAPIAYVPLVAAAPFAAGQGQNGFVACTESSMRVFFLDKLEDVFACTEVPMPRTPRRMIVHPTTGLMVSIESDHVVDTGAWSSAIRVMEPDGGKTLDVAELDPSESAVSICTCVFREYDRERVFVVVGSAANLVLAPKRACDGGFISVYCFIQQHKLALVHKTQVEDAPLAMAAFQGRLLAGIGSTLRLYDMGKKKLLKKCERKDVGNIICQIHAMGERIVIGDVSESFSFAKYNRDENRIVPFADDIAPRWLAAGTFLDYDTIAGSDKFGNIFISRLPKDVTADADEDPTGALLAEKSFLNGAPYRTECVACFHVGDTVTSLQKAALIRGGPEVLVYTTITGAVGALVPLDSREDVNFFQTLEMHMRAENPPLCGRDHLAYRSAYFPVKCVVDGDLCEQFASLPHEVQQDIAQELERTPNEVIEKMADMRHTKLL